VRLSIIDELWVMIISHEGEGKWDDDDDIPEN
jgi:hypothetical protein